MADAVTYLLTRTDVEQALGMPEAVSAVEAAFRAYALGKAQMPPKPYLNFETGDLRIMPAYLPELGLAGVKLVNVHPDNVEFPTVMATLAVFDPGTGFLLAIMDATYLTAVRTGAAGAIAAKYLARTDSTVASFVGAGIQAYTQLLGLLVTVPSIKELLVCDVDADAARALAHKAHEEHGLTAEACSLDDAVRNADILTTTTPVRKPIVKGDLLRPGTHVNAIGADAPGKQELERVILESAKIVVDNWEQASHGGEINVAVTEGVISRDDIHAELGEVAAGLKPGRERPDEITVFDSTGLAIQDLACAAHVYRRVMADEGARAGLRTIDFLAR